jgi:hypothetical protein
MVVFTPIVDNDELQVFIFAPFKFVILYPITVISFDSYAPIYFCRWIYLELFMSEVMDTESITREIRCMGTMIRFFFLDSSVVCLNPVGL